MIVFSKHINSLDPKQKRSFLTLLFVVLLLRSRLITGPRDVFNALKKAAGIRKPTPEELEQARQQLYRRNPDGTKNLLVTYRGRISEVNIQPVSQDELAANVKNFPLVPPSHKPNVDRIFLRQLVSILRITFPSWRSKEVFILILHSTFLVLRTVLSVAVARLDGKIVRDLVSADGKGFLKGIGFWFALAVPSIYTNTMLRHLQSKLSLRARTRISRYTHDLYLSSHPNLRYYRLGLDGAVQYLTSDVNSFCDALSGLYGNLLKPALDIVLFTSQLSRTLGLRGSCMLALTYYATAAILKAVTPAFGRLAAVEARLEGEYRAGMSRIDREGEEIAFYGGGKREREILRRAYLQLIKHINSIYKIRIAYEWTEDYVIKYLWSAAGYVLIAIPYLLTRRKRHVGVQTTGPTGGHVDNQVADRTETYISSRRLLLSLADAGGRLMYAYKDLLELAGLTTRLYTLLSTLHSLPPLPVPSDSTAVEVSHVDVKVPTTAVTVDEGDGFMPAPHELVLVKDLSFKLEEGDHLMITGSNGVGKTSVARVLAGLWPVQEGGEVRRPADESCRMGVFVVPQRVYMVEGTLLDQMIYPHSYVDFKESGKTDADLMDILIAVHLAYLPAREGGWSVRKEWRDVLSGGEKQRMGMARVFYHRPKFAILDECTSAVSSDVEGSMYEHAKSMGITLITISLRPSLMKYHTQLLTLSGDGSGSYTLTRIGTAEERVGIDREIQTLRSKLQEVDKWEARVQELAKLLSVQHESEP